MNNAYTHTHTGTPSPLDPFDNYFRVRLICILLDTCGQYFDRGSSKKKLDAFLVFFQCYLFGKRQPLPLEVEHLVMDTIEDLRPDMEMIATQQEAYEAALELERKFRDKIGEFEYMQKVGFHNNCDITIYVLVLCIIVGSNHCDWMLH